MQEARPGQPFAGPVLEGTVLAHPRFDIGLDHRHDLPDPAADLLEQGIAFGGGQQHDEGPDILGQRKHEILADAAVLVHARRELFAGRRIDVVAELAEGVFGHRAFEPELYPPACRPTCPTVSLPCE